MQVLDHLYLSSSLDPYQNLALENQFLRDPQYFNKKVLLIWRSKPAIVMGRFQNPWMECFLEKSIEDGIQIVRRQSGGGTVFIDEGNINFSFIGNGKKEENFDLITHLLTKFSIKSYVNERNDILVDDKKVSGSAFKKTKDSELHHLSLLIETDIQLVSDYLYCPNDQFNSKSIPSKRSQVLALQERGLDCEMLIQEISPQIIDPPGTGEFLDKMKSDRWIFGETPKFEIEIDGIKLQSHKGLLVAPKKLNLYEFKIWSLKKLVE